MKKHSFFHVTFGTITGTALIFAAFVWGIPWLLDYTGLAGNPAVASLFTSDTRWFFGTLWAVIHFIRSGIANSRAGSFLRFVRTCLLLSALGVTLWYGYTDIVPTLHNIGLTFENFSFTLPSLQQLQQWSDAISQKARELTSEYEPDLEGYSYVITQEGLPPVAVETNSAQADIADLLSQTVFSQPAWLLNQAKVIYVLDDASFQRAMTSHNVVSSPSIAGFSNYSYYDIGDGLLYSNEDEEVYLRLSTLDYETVSHELTHCYDFENDITQRNKNHPFSDQIQALYDSNPYLISEYGAVNVNEFFAEAGALYLSAPQQLQQQSPELYEMFVQMYG